MPTDFEIDSQSTTLGSFSLGLSLSNKPFGDDPEIKDFAFIVGPQGADESSLLQNIQQGERQVSRKNLWDNFSQTTFHSSKFWVII